jgi:succinyl-diaminopimelate desuccinylase
MSPFIKNLKGPESNLVHQVALRNASLISTTQLLVQTPSPNPPGDTTLVARIAQDLLSNILGAITTVHETAPGITNLVCRISSGRPGKCLIFNGHLDTYPLREDLAWTVPPLSGEVKDGRLYGRGVSDMKAGCAAMIVALGVLAENKDLWSGEIVLTLAGDEENGGRLGSEWLLHNVEGVKGDAVVNADVGSPRIVRFGEKGIFWFEIKAVGIAGHGAHVHKGINAIERLRKALDAAQLIEKLEFAAPKEVTNAIAAAEGISQELSGIGESKTLQNITFNVGVINGGVSPNLMPAEASAQCDIRLPIGVTIAQVEAHLQEHIDPMEGISWKILQTYEPTWTSPSEQIVKSSLRAAASVLDEGEKRVANMRVGGSDTRIFRLAGIPSVVVGCTPFGMGAEDEYVLLKELLQVAQIHALIAYDFLSGDGQ